MNREPQWCPIAQKSCYCEHRCEDDAAVRAYAEAAIRRDLMARFDGRPEHDLNMRGAPMKAGR